MEAGELWTTKSGEKVLLVDRSVGSSPSWKTLDYLDIVDYVLQRNLTYKVKDKVELNEFWMTKTQGVMRIVETKSFYVHGAKSTGVVVSFHREDLIHKVAPLDMTERQKLSYSSNIELEPNMSIFAKPKLEVLEPEGHVHADLMKLYAEDAKTTKEPWKNWQFKKADKWMDCPGHPTWHIAHQYRIKIDVIYINGCEVPKPLARATAFDGWVWAPSFSKSPSADGAPATSELGELLILRGVAHSTKEAAILHAKALLSITEPK